MDGGDGLHPDAGGYHPGAHLHRHPDPDPHPDGQSNPDCHSLADLHAHTHTPSTLAHLSLNLSTLRVNILRYHVRKPHTIAGFVPLSSPSSSRHALLSLNLPTLSVNILFLAPVNY